MANPKVTALVDSTVTDLLTRVLPEAIGLGATPYQIAQLASSIGGISEAAYSIEDSNFDLEEIEEKENQYIDRIDELNDRIAQLEAQLEAQVAASSNGHKKEEMLVGGGPRNRLRNRLASRRGFGG